MITKSIRAGKSRVLLRGRLRFAAAVQRGGGSIPAFRWLGLGLFLLRLGAWTIRAAEEGGFRTEANADGTATLYGQGCPTGSVIIPDVVAGRRVSRIGDSAFAGCIQLTNLTIPAGVTHVGARALSMSGLTRIAIPDGVTQVGDAAFAGCAQLTNVVMGQGVVRLADMMFAGCSRLAQVTLPENINGVGGWAFWKCSRLTDVRIPSAVTSIGQNAFEDCTGLTSVTIPESVTSIGNRGFAGCTGLAHVAIPDSVTSIGDGVFAGCTGLTRVSIPDSVTSIEDGAFAACTGLTNIAIGNGVTRIGAHAFYGSGLTSISIPDNVTSMGADALSGCERLTQIFLGRRVQLAEWAFESLAPLPALSVVTVNALNPFYGSLGGVLFDKNRQKLLIPKAHSGGVTIPEGITNLCTWFGDCFSRRPNLTSITIPSTLNVIPADAFLDCVALTNVVLSGGVRRIDAGAFSGCTDLAQVTLSDSVTEIGIEAFRGCRNLTHLTLPNSVVTIGESAFWGCSRLKEIVIPHSVTNLGYSAFANCSSLTGAYFEGRARQPWQVCFSYPSILYYLPGTKGWGPTYSGRPTAPWVRPNPVILDFGDPFGPSTSGFSFVISWATHLPVVVEASADIGGAGWTPISTNTLTDGWVQFTDPEWTSQSARFYRVRGR